MKNIFLVLLLSISLPAFAGWSDSWGEVTQVMSHNGHHVMYTTISDEVCGNKGQFWWPADDADAKDMFAIALAALMSGKEVLVVYNSSTPQCDHGSAAKATHIRVRR